MKALLVSILLSLFSLTARAQITRYVSTTGTNSMPASATSWASSTTDLQGAIDASNAGDQVWVATGIYKPTTITGPASRTISFAMKNGVSILGGFAGSGSTPDARSPLSSTLSGDTGTAGVNSDNSYHIIYNTGLDATARLDNFIITGGNANGTFTATVGGGMYNNASSPRLTNCLFQSNTATVNGGAMYNASGNGSASPTLINCAFLTNSATEGGGMYNYANSGTASPTLTNCSFQGNSAREGGAIANYRSTDTAREAAQARLAAAGTANPTLTNCVLFNNGENKTIRNVNGANLIADYSLFDNIVTGYSTDPTNLTTLTTPYANPTSTQLFTGSPAIDTGNSAATGLVGITIDLDNNPRIVGCRVDMGANEFQTNTNHPLTITTQPAPGSAVCVGGVVTVTVSVTGTVTAYQWYKDGALLSPAQTTFALSLTNVQAGDTGSYSVVVTGACNAVTSTAFSLTVNVLPNPTLTASNGLGIVYTTLTCVQTLLTLTGSSSGTGSLAYPFGGPSGLIGGSGNTRPINQSGGYSLTVTNTSTGCYNTTSLVISQNNSGVQSLSLNLLLQSVNCEAARATLAATPGASSYRFVGPGIDQTGAANALPISVAGTYSVTAHYGRCLAAANITTGAAPNPILLGNGSLSCATPTLSLSVLGSGPGTVFSGSPGGPSGIVSQSDGIERIVAGSYLICRTPIPNYAWAIVNQPGVYTVRVVGANGLVSSAMITVTGQACPKGGR